MKSDNFFHDISQAYFVRICNNILLKDLISRMPTGSYVVNISFLSEQL